MRALPPANPNPAIEGLIAWRIEELFSVSAEAAIAHAIQAQLPPMLTSVVESCTKQFYSHVASSIDGKRAKRSTQPSCASRHPPSGSASGPHEEDIDMDDADDEDDMDEYPHARSRGKKSLTTNGLHVRCKLLLMIPISNSLTPSLSFDNT